MRISKITFIISTILTIITFALSVTFTFFIKGEITDFICSISGNIFAGTVVLMITSLFEYFINKRDNLDDLLLQIRSTRKIFANLKFVNCKDFVELSKYIEFYKDELCEEEIVKRYNNDKNQYQKKQKEQIEACMREYINLSEINSEVAWRVYKDTRFLLDFRNKKRKKIFNDFIDYIFNQKMNKVIETSWHFKEYFNSKYGNYEVNKDFFEKLQNEIFDYEEKTYLEGGFREEFDMDKANVDICSYGDNAISGTYFICGNKVTKHLQNLSEYVWKLNYKNKKK